MRSILPGDLSAVARAVSILPQDRRLIAVMEYCDRASAADRFRKRTGRCHPLWGDGTLAAVVGCEGEAAGPGFPDRDWYAAQRDVLDGVLRWMDDPARSSGAEHPDGRTA